MSAAALALATVGCGHGDQSPTPSDPAAIHDESWTNSFRDANSINSFRDIDVDAWRARLVNEVEALPTIDMTDMYREAVSYCGYSVQKMAIALSASARGLTPRNVGARTSPLDPQYPQYVRIHLSYVCPGRVDVVDEALASQEQGMAESDEACSTPPGQRTPRQQLIAETLNCD